MSSVGIEFPKELARCRELRKFYLDMGPQGTFAHALLEGVVLQAEAAWESQDVVAIVRAFAAMRECR